MAVVDIHSHNFNGDDLPVKGFVKCVGGMKVKLVKALAQYEGIAPVLDQTSIDRVVGLYYTHGVGGPGGYGKVASATSDAIEPRAADAEPVAPTMPGPVSTF